MTNLNLNTYKGLEDRIEVPSPMIQPLWFPPSFILDWDIFTVPTSVISYIDSCSRDVPTGVLRKWICSHPLPKKEQKSRTIFIPCAAKIRKEEKKRALSVVSVATLKGGSIPSG